MLAIQQVCNADSGAACERVKLTEVGKFVGSTSPGALSGVMAGAASGSICIAMGVATGGFGGVICVAAIVGAGAWVGTTGGGMAGEAIGEKLYQVNQP